MENRSLPFPQSSPWSGWASGWSTPNFNVRTGISKLIDIAYACTDLNSNVLSAMPVYHTVAGQITDPLEWMNNPDPTIYSSWLEFAKQLFWDFQMGETFVLAMSKYADGYPQTFRVIPPWLVNVELKSGSRIYNIGSHDVTDRILHIRYKSTIDDARGHGPLETAGARMTAIGMLGRYTANLAETGGVTKEWIGVDRVLRNTQEAKDLLESWIETRTKYAGYPAVLGSGSKLNQAQTMNARDMALMELSQFNESRIAILLGVPPFLVGLAGASGSLTYCVSDDTEVLTQRGWLTCDDVQIGEPILTLDHETGVSTWQPITAINIFDVADEPMLSMHGRGHSSLTTLAHRWPIIDKDTGKRRWVDSDHLGAQHKIVLAAPCADLPEYPKHSDEFVELIAWFMTEGFIDTTRTRIYSGISQSMARNPVNVAAIGHALTLLFGPAREKGKRTADGYGREIRYVKLFGDDAAWVEDRYNYNEMVSFRLNQEATQVLGYEALEGDWHEKVVSFEFLNSLTLAQLHLFIDTCIKADGSTVQGRGDQRVFIQQYGPRMERFRYACTLAGISTSVYPRTGSDCVTVGVKKRATYNPTFHNASPPERVTWSGRVWCPTTANGTWYARRKDREFFTGNSNIADLFDFHDRSSLRPKARMVMEALSEWALPRGHAAELNRDDYTRLPVDKRYTAYKTAVEAGFIFPEEVRAIERLGPIPPGARAVQQTQQQPSSATPNNPNTQSTPSTPSTNGKVNTEAAKNLSGGAD